MGKPKHFSELFILSSPYSGTTAMAKLLMTSRRTWSRSRSAEGQRLAEALPFVIEDRWSPRSVIDWAAFKEVLERGRPAGKVLLEKSHWILMHADEVLEFWPDAFFVISIRHPIGVLASLLSRREANDEVLSGWQIRWSKHSKQQRANVERLADRSLVTTYSSFARNPGGLLDRLDGALGPLGIDPEAKVQLKKYDPAPVTDHDARQIAKLSREVRDRAEMLLRQPRLASELAFWGFDASGPA